MRKRKTVQQTVFRFAASLLHQNEKRNATAAPLVFRFSFDAICLCAERPKVDATMWSEHPRSKFAHELEEFGKMATATFILFRGSKRISIREGDMNTGKISRIFQVSSV